MEQYVWIIIMGALLACIAVLSVLLVRFVRAHREAELSHSTVEADLTSEKQELQQQLNSERRRKEELLDLLDLIEAAYAKQGDRIGVFAFDRESGECLIGNETDDAVALSITAHDLSLLREKLQGACGGVACGENDTYYFITCELSERFEVYAALDVTASENLPLLQQKEDELRRRLADSDVLTGVMNLDALISHASVAIVTQIYNLLLLRTEMAKTSGVQVLTGFREAYQKACADILLDAAPDGLVGRAGEDTFVCLIPSGDTPCGEELLDKIAQAREALCPRDEHPEQAIILEITPCIENMNLRETVEAMSIRATEDQLDGLYGARDFDLNCVPMLLSRRAELEHFLDRESIRFGYRPFATADEARTFGYELVPNFRNPKYSSLEYVLREAIVFGGLERLESKLFNEALRCFKRTVSDCKVFYNTAFWLRSPKGCIMPVADERKFSEEYYDELPYLVVEMDEKDFESRLCAQIKLGRAARWRSRTALCYSGPQDLAAIESLRPSFVRISVSVFSDPSRDSEAKDLLRLLDTVGAHICVDDITTPAGADAAIAVGAKVLGGEYVGAEAEIPSEINDKCVKRIAQKRFGSRRYS